MEEPLTTLKGMGKRGTLKDGTLGMPQADLQGPVLNLVSVVLPVDWGSQQKAGRKKAYRHTVTPSHRGGLPREENKAG